MIKKSSRVAAIVVVVAAVSIVSGYASAQNKYNLNAKAYETIPFGQIFGLKTGVAFKEPSTAEATPPSTAKDEGTLSLSAFVDKLLVNLRTYAPTDPADVELRNTTITRLDSLRSYINTNSVAANGFFGSWPLRWFFEADIQNAVFSSQAIQNCIRTLFSDHLLPLEKDGLTLPWLLTSAKGANADFLDLVFNTRFLQRLARMTFKDFFELNAESPLVDDELMELTRRGIVAGVFGAFQTYYNDPKAAVDIEDLVGTEAVAGNAKCCHRTTRKCVDSETTTDYCVNVGSYCCLGATWCSL